MAEDLFGKKADAAPAKPKAAKKAVAKKAAPKPVKKKAGTAVTVHKPKPPQRVKPAKVTGAMSMLAFIGQAAQDPSVDPAKMRELLSIRKELKQEEAFDQFNAAFLKAQTKLSTIRITKKGIIEIYDKNDREHRNAPIQRTRYTKYEDLSKIITPILHANGLAVRHRNGTNPDGKVKITTLLTHTAGHSEESEFIAEIDASGSKNNVQGRGSTISYGKRYNVTSLLDLISEEDDDGNQAKFLAVTQEQLTQIIEAADAAGVDKRLFCEFLGVESLAKIPAVRFEEAMNLIKQKANTRK